MEIRYTYGLIALLLLQGFSACDTTNSDSDFPENTIRFEMNGTDREFRDAVATRWKGTEQGLDYTTERISITATYGIEGESPQRSDYMTIRISDSLNIKSGTIPFTWGAGRTYPDAEISIKTYNELFNEQWDYTRPENGSLTIKKITDEFISGTFSVRVYKYEYPSDTLYIENGEFRVNF